MLEIHSRLFYQIIYKESVGRARLFFSVVPGFESRVTHPNVEVSGS